jgi:general stress protein YciG
MSEEKQELSVREAGRRGGNKVKETYGHDHFVEIGRKGGLATQSRFGPEHYKEIGTKGAAKNKGVGD